MAWKKIQYRLTGDSPLIVHNGQTADPLNPVSKAMKSITGKRKKTDSDYEQMAKIEFMGALYMGEKGPIIPAENIEATIVNAAKTEKEGKLAKCGMFVSEQAVLEYDGPKDPEKLWADTEFRIVRPVKVGMSRVIRTRPIFNKWSTVVTISYDDNLINKNQIDRWVDIGGATIGVCDWRPKYGRFSVSSVK